MSKNRSYIFILFISLVVSKDCVCSDAKFLASLMSAYIRTQTPEQTSPSIAPQALYQNMFPEMVTHGRQLQVLKSKSKKTSSRTHALWSSIKNSRTYLTSLAVSLCNKLSQKKDNDSTRDNKNKYGLMLLPSITREKLIIQTGVMASTVFGALIIMFVYFEKECGKNLLYTPVLLKLFITKVINEIRKHYYIKHSIRPLLFKPVMLVDDRYLQPVGYTDIELEALERVLMSFNDDNTITCTALNQNIICNTVSYNVICYGTILDALFFRAAMTFDEPALQLFFKYNTHNKINMKLRKIGTYDYYSSLLACMACKYCRSKEKLRCIELMLNTIPFRNNDQIEGFIHDIITEVMETETDTDTDKAAKKTEEIIINQGNSLEIKPITTAERDFSSFLLRAPEWDESAVRTRKFIKLALQHMTGLKTMNAHYQGIDVNYFIQSRYITDRDFIESIKPLFFRNDGWYDDSNQNLSFLSVARLFLRNYRNSPDCYEAYSYYMQLLLSYGIEIPDSTNIMSEIKEDMTQAELDLSKQFGIEIPDNTNIRPEIRDMVQKELDFRKQFLRFDDQENQLELFRHILERTSQPAIWMIRVIRSDQEGLKQIDMLFSHCVKQFYKLLRQPIWDKQYIHYLDSWKSLLVFLSRENPNIFHQHKKIIGKCMTKIIEHNCFDQTPDHENSIALKSFLLYCLGQDDPEIPFPDLCQQGDLGNILHLSARSGLYNQTITNIMNVAKNKGEEFAVLRALTQVFKKSGFKKYGHTPLDLAQQEIDFALREERDASPHKETLAIMNNFIDTCCKELPEYKKLSDYKKSPHTAYSSWEDQVNTIKHKSKKPLRIAINQWL